MIFEKKDRSISVVETPREAANVVVKGARFQPQARMQNVAADSTRYNLDFAMWGSKKYADMAPKIARA